MATLAEWTARNRQRLVTHFTGGLLSPHELFGSLLDTFSHGEEATEFAADPPDIREQVCAFLAGFRPDPFPPVFVFGRLEPGEADRIDRERRAKYAALLAALGLVSPPSV